VASGRPPATTASPAGAEPRSADAAAAGRLPCRARA